MLGLGLGECFEYTAGSAAQTPPDLGAAVESTTATAVEYLPDGGSVTGPALQLTYRVHGTPTMSDYLKVEGSSLYLLKRQVSGAESVEYKPAVVLARIPLRNGDHLDQLGQDREFIGSTDTGDQPYELTFNVISGQVPTVEATFDGGFQLAYVEAPTHHRLDGWSFAPGVGPVALQGAMGGDLADGGAVSATYQLQAHRTLSASGVCSSGQ